ncbi:Short-chain dehydrogenase/reductase family 42E member 1 [Auxenochlorella protothecoides]|uniref:Short-chain dehydrogenase/reductase family 42E member 1 n=1 Tax=Auxenochlorella protothecoides TaxID=3075 RepID=A0A087SCF6_AUXPR|nr:Short-chain dehydrogenase/reductase family 42E member 1 [Auxenochlorella protothecoides]KFM23410.1 Short-chain dehydrogenase/reductase family 42E member 1 [Auxenochlorella protothecoides]
MAPRSGKAVVIGGGGYFGNRLAKRLAALGYDVVALDVRVEPAAGVEAVVGDVRDAKLLQGIFQGADVVFHTASYGMSMREQLHTVIIHAVNVQGTDNVVAACIACGVPSLVYTSTYNTVFGGVEIVAGDESLPLFPLDAHCDAYSRTKALAEQAVLAADGARHVGKDGDPGRGRLHTTALRPAAIYGAGERRHLPRTVENARRGWYKCTFGKPSSLTDMVHVDNLVEAHVLAARSLAHANGGEAAGQAYFISDGSPINMFRFFEPLLVGLGFPTPHLRLPLLVVYCLAWLTELIWQVVHPVWDFEPLLVRAEVLKVGVTHYFSIDKARTELGYAPISTDLVQCGALEWFLERMPEERPRGRGGSVLFVLAALIGVFLVLHALLRA